MSQNLNIPTHVGIIVDGNRRWAKAQGLPTLAGHQRGYQNVRIIVKHLLGRGVSYVTCYLFSRENWKRSSEEVAYLMQLLTDVLRNEVASFIEDSIRLTFIGNRSAFSPELQLLMEQAEARTAAGTAGTFVAALNYGGQQDILEAVQKLAKSGANLTSVTAEELKQALSTAHLPPCDLIIRTSGEQRLSNFLLWEGVYAELYFSPVMFPDFSEAQADEALGWYAGRSRRFGS